MRRPVTTAAYRAGRRAPGVSAVYEMQEFAGFAAGEQRYIRRSLDVGLERGDAAGRWARDAAEAASIAAQAAAYARLAEVRASVHDVADLDSAAALMAPLVRLVAFDLLQARLHSFAACRFLYERLVGAAVRPWLPAAFCAAAALPQLHPERRRLLLASLPEEAAAASGWSPREPVFLPEWVDSIDPAVAP
jgi:hypothetical protein